MREEKVYEIKFNEEGKRVCVVDGEEIEVVRDYGSSYMLANGKSVYKQLKKDDRMVIDKRNRR